MVQKSNFFWAKQRNKMKEKGKGKREKGKVVEACNVHANM